MNKEDYTDLKGMVEKLDSVQGIESKDNCQRIEILQNIGKKLINEYKIVIDDVTIEPLLVEAYYCKDKNGKFVDCNCHQNPKQKGVNRFGKLYFHKIGRGGVDICLPLDEYYLSFLVKVAKIKKESSEETKQQIEIFCELSQKPNAENRGDILIHCPSEKSHCTVCVPRKNTLKGKFAKAPLAIVSIDAFKDQKDKPIADAIVKSLEHKKQWTVAKYGLEKAQCDIERAREIIKNENLYSGTIENTYMESALEYIKNKER